MYCIFRRERGRGSWWGWCGVERYFDLKGLFINDSIWFRFKGINVWRV